MGKERTFKLIKKTRASGFIHIGRIIPGVLRDVERRIKESHKDKKVTLRIEAEEEAS